MKRGSPLDLIRSELSAMGFTLPEPPSPRASIREAVEELWTGAGLVSVDTSEFMVERCFLDFDEFWRMHRMVDGIRSIIASMEAAEVNGLNERVRARCCRIARGA
jgi:hypothetical protein